MLCKARTGCPRSGLSAPAGSLARVWQRGLTSGFWEQLMNAWVDSPGEVPPEGGVMLPPLEVRGRVEDGLIPG